MKKKDFVTLILSIVGGILFAFGVCIALVPEMGSRTYGIVIGVIGVVVVLAMLPIRLNMDGKLTIVFNLITIFTMLLGTIGAVALGLGMCMAMVWNMIASGIVTGIVGIVMLLCLIPVIRGLK